MTIWLVGSYGNGNVGDDMLGHVAAHLAEIEAQDATEVRILAGAGWTLGPFTEQRRRVVARKLQPGDRLVIAGGGLLNDQFGLLFLRYFASLAFIARLKLASVHIAGVGVEQLTSRRARFLARLLFSLSSTVSVRDDHSLQVASKVTSKARRGADLGWAVSDLGLAHPEPRLDATVITIAVETPDKAEARQEILRLVIRGLLGKTTGAVWLVPMQNSSEAALDDAAHLRRLAEEFSSDRVRVFPIMNYREVYKLLSSSSLYIGFRLHAGILAVVSRTRTIAIARSPKVREALEGVGGTVVIEETSASETAAAVLSAINRKFAPWSSEQMLTQARAARRTIQGALR